MDKMRDWEKHALSGIDFTAFKNVLPVRIGLTDIDGELERHRWFLRLEKKKVGDKMTEGQRILLEHLSDLPEFTVIVFWGSEFNPRRVEQWVGRKHIQVASLTDFLGSWWDWADKQPNARRRG